MSENISADGGLTARSPHQEPGNAGDKIRQGVRWSAFSKYGAQLIQFVVSIILARLLAPETFGLMSMATLVIGFGSVFASLGLNNAIIRKRAPTKDFLSSVFVLQLILAGVVALGIALSAPLAAMFFQEHNVTGLILALAAGFFIGSLAIIPTAILQKQLAFKTLAIREILAALLGGAVAVAAAVGGMGVWSFVLGSLTAEVIGAITVFRLVKWRPALVFRSNELEGTFSFGLNLFGIGITNYFARKGDDVIIGAALGKGSLGIYSVAYRLMLLPRDAVTAVVGRVLYPAMSQFQDDDEQLSALYVRCVAAIGFITFPMMMGLATIASPFVTVVLGPAWRDAIPLIWILAPIGMIQSITSTQSQLFMTKGRTGILFRYSLVVTFIRVCLFLVTVRYGLIPLAAVYAATAFAFLPVGLRLSNALVEGLSSRRILEGLFPPLAMSSVMGTGVWSLDRILRFLGAGDVLILCTCVPIGIFLYSAMALIWRPPATNDFLELMPLRFSTRRQT
ncbi:MAG: lipopolysaccharide biosynthesis protein [Pirellulales bacterium]|nr:lipopolysaccharide biosynthesis protein [Pirellulales bacterium]